MTTPQPVQPDPQEHDEAHAVTRTDAGQETRSQDGAISGLRPLSVNSLQAGSTLGPYRLIAKLGAGGMGMVFRAEHTHLGKEVALKVLPTGMTQNPAAVARFKREMKAVGKITHQHIVQAFDAGEVGGVHYLAMECIEGTDLQKLVHDRGPLSPANAAKAIRQAALGLAAAHALKLYHRDIKPSNMLVTKGGQIKLLDLGLARLAEEAAEATELTVEGAAMGTPDFMAPEQWEDSRTADARSDLYALGCTLFFLLTGRAPYQTENSRTLVNKMKAHVATPAPDLRTVREGVPEPLVAIYEKLMAKDPAARYQTAAELVEALRPLASSKAAASASARGETSTFLSVTGEEVAPRKPARRWAFVAAAGAFAVALLMGVIIIITIRNRDGVRRRIDVPDTSTLTVTPPEKNGLPVPPVEAASPAAVPAAMAATAGPGPSPATPVEPVSQRVDDRPLAEWAISRGATVLIEPGWVTIAKVGDLPAGEFHVREANFGFGHAPITRADAERIAQGIYLRGVGVAECPNFDEVLPSLARLPRLQTLNLGDVSHVPASWSPLGRNECLVHLSLAVLDPNAGWDWLGSLPSLRTLNVWGTNRLPLNGFGRHESLRVLVYHGETIDEDLVRQIQQNNPKLRILRKRGDEVSALGNDPFRVAAMTLLKRGVRFEVGRYSDAGGVPLTKEMLESETTWQPRTLVCEPETQLTREDAALISDLAEGDYLSVTLSGQREADALARELASVPRIWQLDLSNSALTDAGLSEFERLIDVRYLTLAGTRVTPAGIARFRSVHPTCSVISDSGELPPDFTVPLRTPAEVARASGRTSSSPARDPERDLARFVLELRGRIVVEPDFQSVTTMENIPSKPFIVSGVEFPPGLPPLDAEQMRFLTASRHLKALSVPDNNDAVRYVDGLSAIPALQVLAIGDAGTSGPLAALGRSGRLTRITTGLSASETSWAFIKGIASLRSLDVWTSYPPTFADMGVVPNLRLIWIYDTAPAEKPVELDSEVVERLQAANPDLRILVERNGQPLVIGRDPVVPLAERLLSRGVSLFGTDLKRTSGQPVTAESLKGMKVPAFYLFGHEGNPSLAKEDRALMERMTSGDHTSVRFSRQTDSDDLARQIARCGLLNSVSLTDCDLTDAGLANLASAADLRSLELTRTEVTEVGLRRFHRFHPTCEIVSDVVNIAKDYHAPVMSPAEIRKELELAPR